jgi:hypothetical protein
MTPGQEALIEAARMERARIYSSTLPEHRPEPANAARPTGAELDSAIAYWRRRGLSVASVAFRLGTTRSVVNDTVERLAAGAAANDHHSKLDRGKLA